MNLKIELSNYIKFNLWANIEMTNWLLSNDQSLMSIVVSSSFPSINATLAHIWVAEYIWMSRIQGESYENIHMECENKDIDFIVDKLLSSSRKLIDFIGKTDEMSLSNDIKYTYIVGEKGHAKLAQILQHVVNHGSYHRGQLVSIGRGLGFTNPPNTDYMGFCRINN